MISVSTYLGRYARLARSKGAGVNKMFFFNHDSMDHGMDSPNMGLRKSLSNANIK